MQSIGEALKNAREQKGISLEQAEEDTKIRKRYLQALEDGEFTIIPGAVYVKGFLRNYASYLGLNQEEIMIEYKLFSAPVRETGPRSDVQEAINKRRTNSRTNSRTNRRAYVITVVVAVIALLTYISYGFIFDGDPNNTGQNGNENSAQSEKPPQTGQPPKTGTPSQTDNDLDKGPEESNNNNAADPGENTSQEKPNVESPVAGDQVTVVLKGKNESWARVTVDGRVVFTGEIKPGEVKQFIGNTGVKFRLGNAGGVEVNVNGQELGSLGTAGEVIDKEYTKE